MKYSSVVNLAFSEYMTKNLSVFAVVRVFLYQIFYALYPTE
jgi:hypothetical protein